MDIEKELLSAIKESQFTSMDDIKVSINGLKQNIQNILIQKIEKEIDLPYEKKIDYENLAKLWIPDISWRWQKISIKNEDGNVKKYFRIELVTTSDEIDNMLSNYMKMLKRIRGYLKVPESVLLSTLNSMDIILKPENRNDIIDLITRYYDVRFIDYDDDHVHCFKSSEGNVSECITTKKAIIGVDGKCLVEGSYVTPFKRKEL